MCQKTLSLKHFRAYFHLEPTTCRADFDVFASSDENSELALTDISFKCITPY